MRAYEICPFVSPTAVEVEKTSKYIKVRVSSLPRKMQMPMVEVCTAYS